MDFNLDNADHLELLHDFRNGYDDLANARELDRAEDEGPAAPATESAAPMDKEQADAEPSEELEPPSKRTCIRYSREQKSVLEREFERGAARLSNRDIAMDIDMMPEGHGRKVAACDVQNVMSARARRLKIQQVLNSGTGEF